MNCAGDHVQICEDMCRREKSPLVHQYQCAKLQRVRSGTNVGFGADGASFVILSVSWTSRDNISLLGLKEQ